MSFELNVPVAELAKTRKLFISTPMYAGACTGIYTRSMMELVNLCTRMNIPHQPHFLFNESLITRARNYCVDEFLRSDCTHMIFVDSDIGFSANDVIALLAMQSDDSPYDVLGGSYAKKCISWEKIKQACDKGFADENPEELSKYVGDYVFNPKGGGSISIGEPAEVLEIGTGFMMIRRKTFEIFKENFPEFMYRPDHARSEAFDGTREIMQFFQAEIDPKSKRYLSEDYYFCQKIQELGLKTWLCPWMQLQHAGSYIFGGSLADLAALGASPTADVSKVAGGKRGEAVTKARGKPRNKRKK